MTTINDPKPGNRRAAAYPVDHSHITMGDPAGMDLDAIFIAIEDGHIADAGNGFGGAR